MDGWRHQRRTPDSREVVEAAEPSMAALCQSRAMDDVLERKEPHNVCGSFLILDRALMVSYDRYAGAWSVLNMHELAVTSGFAAAYQLGAEYPFKDDEDCSRLFKLYLGLSHGSRLRKEDRKGFFT